MVFSTYLNSLSKIPKKLKKRMFATWTPDQELNKVRLRHEAAEALGSIADVECLALLVDFAKDPEPIVSQSCEVALSMLEFEISGKSFEFLFMQVPHVEQVS
ncbi:hypothetical protein HAX54_010844 [Datura stramonium]|uniref:Uncharacterized protein n=1 Tax=Datura stramonium TaxID=4076 RepID=A0ABS8TGW8_DATST|nr:hypothetical protein [Datura stramonium]